MYTESLDIIHNTNHVINWIIKQLLRDLHGSEIVRYENRKKLYNMIKPPVKMDTDGIGRKNGNTEGYINTKWHINTKTSTISLILYLLIVKTLYLAISNMYSLDEVVCLLWENLNYLSALIGLLRKSSYESRIPSSSSVL